MTKSVYYFTAIIFFVFNSKSFAQKYKEGVCEIGLVSIESISGSPIDSTKAALIRNQVEGMVGVTVYFKNNRTVFEKTVLGSTSRSVYDLDTKKFYEFKELLDQPSFTINDISEEVLSNLEKPLMDPSTFGEGIKLKEKIYGLDCTKYELPQGENTMNIVMTKDFSYFDLLRMSPMPKENGTLVYTTLTNPDQDMILTIGIKSFSPIVKDQDIFSIDTTGLVNQTALTGSMREAFVELAEEDQKNLEEYGEYESASINQELIQDLVTQGVFDGKNWKVSSALKNKNSYDIPNILLLATRAKEGLPKMSRTAIKDVFNKNNILTPEVEKLLLLEEIQWNKIPEKYRYQAICLAAVKDHLNTKKTKNQIVNNLHALKYGDFKNNAVSKAYINGNAPLEDVLSETNIFTRLETGIALSDKDIYQKIIGFYNIVSQQSGFNLEISQEDNIVLIKSASIIHTLDINNLKEIDYSERDVDSEPSKIMYSDTTKIDKAFYSKLLNTVKQLGADHRSDLAYNIYQLTPPFVNGINEYAYRAITLACPFLAIDSDAIYFQQFQKEEYDPYTGLGTSFPYHPDAEDKEVNLGNFKVGDIDAGIDYITSSQKKMFVQYLKENHKSFKIDTKELDYNIEQIQKELIAGPDNLLQFIPNISFKVSKIFSTTPKSEYRPSFSEDRNDFKDAYRTLYYVIGDDFLATDFSYDSEAHKIYFKYKGQEHSVNPGDRNMVRFIIDHVKNTKSGKKIYPVSLLSVTTEQYYYLTPKQKSQLNKIVPLGF